MKVTLDLDQLLSTQQINQAEYDKFSRLAAHTTGSLALNILVAFGVVAVSAAAIFLLPNALTAIFLGLCLLLAGGAVLRGEHKTWRLLANINVLVGALMAGGGLLAEFEVSTPALLVVTVLYALAAAVARSGLLAALAVLTLSASVGAYGDYWHASYMLAIRQPTLTIALFSALAAALYWTATRCNPDYQPVAVIAARTSVFIVNLGFWIGSLWGDRLFAERVDRGVLSDIGFDFYRGGFELAREIFSVSWALALMVVAVYAWRSNNRWLLNAAATFGGIHFYTQWFEHLGASPETVMLAGVLALVVALAIARTNQKMKTNI